VVLAAAALAAFAGLPVLVSHPRTRPPVAARASPSSVTTTSLCPSLYPGKPPSPCPAPIPRTTPPSASVPCGVGQLSFQSEDSGISQGMALGGGVVTLTGMPLAPPSCDDTPELLDFSAPGEPVPIEGGGEPGHLISVSG